MKTINTLIALTVGAPLLCAIAACETPAIQPVAQTAVVMLPPAASIADEASRYAASLKTLSAPELESEYVAANRRFQQSGALPDRVKLVILLALPDTPFHNTEAARDFLRDAGGSDDAQYAFVSLLDTLLAGQQRAEAATEAANQALASEKAHSRSLQGKIDAVKNLEISPARKE